MPVVAPVRSVTSFPAIVWARCSALATSVFPVSSRAFSDAADPITPTLIRISVVTYRWLNHWLFAPILNSYLAWSFTHILVPPAPSQKPGDARQQKHETDPNSHRPRRHVKASE